MVAFIGLMFAGRKSECLGVSSDDDDRVLAWWRLH